MKINKNESRYNSVKIPYKRGCIDCINFIVRASVAVPEVHLLKLALKLLAFLYIYFGSLKYAIGAFERLRDVAYEDLDFNTVMFAFK